MNPHFKSPASHGAKSSRYVAPDRLAPLPLFDVELRGFPGRRLTLTMRNRIFAQNVD